MVPSKPQARGISVQLLVLEIGFHYGGQQRNNAVYFYKL